MPRADDRLGMKVQLARDAADAFERYVFVDEKGEARELYERECEFLAVLFDADDLSVQPYVKTSYDALTPDGTSIHGLLERRFLPRGAKVEPRPDPERFTRPRPFARTRAIFRDTVLPLIVGVVNGYAALLIGAFICSVFLRVGMRELSVVAFIVAAFFGTLVYLAYFVAFVLVATDHRRDLRFAAATAVWLGALAGAIWVLWLHGDPSRILRFR